MAMITNSKQIKNIPPERLVRLWDLFTGNVSPMTIERYNKLRGAGATATAAYHDFNQRFYNLNDFPGQKIEMYHLKRGHLIEEMTLSLFSEIQKRNPVINTPVFENGVKISEVFEPYKNYLATPEEVKSVSSPKVTKSIEEIVRETVQAEVGRKLAENEKHIEEVQEVVEPSKSEAPKPGRRKKVISEPKNA